MPSSETVSVVIPCFDQGEFLGEAIDSALAQEHELLEVVVVDDGSTDSTPQVLARYPTVRVVRRPRGGVSAARNAGLAAARGEFVEFLDADDRLLRGALAANLAVLRAAPDCAFVAGHHVRVDARNRPLDVQPPPEATDAVYERLLRGNCVHTAAVMYRRAPLVEAGGFDPGLDVCEDWELYLRLSRRHAARLHAQVVTAYRQYGGQTTAQALGPLLRCGLAVLAAQRPLLRTAREKAAWQAGRRYWRQFYGDLLLSALRKDLRGGRPAAAWRRAGVLLRYAFGYASGRVVRKVLRRAPAGAGKPASLAGTDGRA